MLTIALVGFLNYLHALNPNAKCYLSQMNTLGADNSQNEIYHGWFWDGTVYDNALTSSIGPFPGLLIGGPNQDYTGAVSPLSGQPAQKAYKDWNADYPEASYEITEIGIYTQAAYIRLASRFMGGTTTTCTLAAGTAASAQSGNWTDRATWQCGTIPTVTSLTQIKAGHVITINGTAYSNRVQFESAAKVIYGLSGRLVMGQ